MLVLLCLTVSGAWADDLYLKSDDNFATATLMYDGNKGDNPYYQSDKWNGPSVSVNAARNNVTTITVNASCQNFTGTSLKLLFRMTAAPAPASSSPSTRQRASAASPPTPLQRARRVYTQLTAAASASL